MACDPFADEPAPRDDGPNAARRWRELLRHVGEDISAPLTSALERIDGLTSTGRIDRQALRALRDELEAARRAGLVGQQLAHFGSGRVRQSQERLPLMQTLQAMLTRRAGETMARGVRLEQVHGPVEVIVDAALLHALCDAMLDWALTGARSAVELRIDTRPWPAHARLHCRFARRTPDEGAAAHESAPTPDPLAWRLVEQIAWTMGLWLERSDDARATRLTLEFPHTVGDRLEDSRAVEHDGGTAPIDSRLLAGCQVLIVAAHHELRGQVREAIRHLGLIVDSVHGVAEAATYAREGLPHAVIYEATLADTHFLDWREQVRRDVPGLPFIEIADGGDTLQLSVAGGSRHARVGRAAIRDSLPSALLFELSKSL